jgi:hypothetical protein
VAPSQSNDHPHRLRLFVLLAAALGVRLTWALAQPVTDEAIDRLPDQREYLALGRNLLAPAYTPPCYGTVQSTILKPGMLAKSRVLWVTSVRSWTSAVAPMNRSISGDGRPWSNNVARTWPKCLATASVTSSTKTSRRRS